MGIYRSPSRKTILIMNSLNDVNNNISTKNIVLIGDTNIDIYPNNLDPLREKYLMFRVIHGIFPTHLSPRELIPAMTIFELHLISSLQHLK